MIWLYLSFKSYFLPLTSLLTFQFPKPVIIFSPGFYTCHSFLLEFSSLGFSQHSSLSFTPHLTPLFYVGWKFSIAFLFTSHWPELCSVVTSKGAGNLFHFPTFIGQEKGRLGWSKLNQTYSTCQSPSFLSCLPVYFVTDMYFFAFNSSMTYVLWIQGEYLMLFTACSISVCWVNKLIPVARSSGYSGLGTIFALLK